MRFFATNLRSKLILIILVALAVGLTLVGSALYFRYQTYLYNQIEGILTHYAGLAETSLDLSRMEDTDLPYLREFAVRIAATVDCRVTLINPDGNVVADSEIPIDSLGYLDNHLRRPEVQASLAKGIGFNIRRSKTISKDLLYLSKTINFNGKHLGFLRLAMFGEETNEMLDIAQLFFVLGGISILLISSVMVVLLSRRINRNLDIAIEKARQIASGDLDVKIELDSDDELGELGSSLNTMAMQLSRYIRRLSRERQELDTVLSSINEGILAINRDKKIIFFNDLALSLLAVPLQQIRGQYYYQIIRNEHLNSLLESFLAKPVLISDEVRLDDNRTLEAVIAPVRMHNSEEVGAVMVLRDISHFKKLEKIRTDFVANVSHEFKTPLAAIRGYAESMLDWGLEDEEISRKYLRKVLKQSHQLENLVADLLQLARIERLQNIELSPFNPHPLLNDIVHQYAELATSKQLEFTYQEPTEPALVPGDPEMFRSIIVNLVDNAIKYTPEGGRVSLSVNTTSN
ncbi:MAG TPA: histidine kinase dimerization/phospho-acceptor domain-containing protein, partial [Calditrichia bacterium]|nr:histidine kinase dimerization/phospho-acceptor domain-containing protein [Calditrichia bacterium]